ncbi:hypothetical protein ACVWW1_003608 [Bradyrhizobium sp. JR3.5]
MIFRKVSRTHFASSPCPYRTISSTTAEIATTTARMTERATSSTISGCRRSQPPRATR